MKAISASIIVCAGVWLFSQGGGNLSNFNTEFGLGLGAVGLIGWVISILRAE
jgi:hypothetical protein